MEITRIYLQKKFREYYLKMKPEVRELERREWAFSPLKTFPDFVMYRHISFSSEDEFKAYVLNNTPLHSYYSSAYYERPGEERMEDKGWIKADLIFDIDADHLPVKDTNTFEGMLRALKLARKEILRLYEMLEKDFGIKDMEIVFSGSRGYHIHVYDEDYLTLGSAERREIVNYFTLNRIGEHLSTQRLRVCRCSSRLMLLKIKSGNAGSEKLLESLKRKLNRSTLKALSRCDTKSLRKREKAFFEECFRECVEKLRIHIDEPVTSDTHRLIRLPNSLHGKTGFIVKPLEVDELEDFEPYRDAIAFGSESVKVRCIKHARLKIGEVNLNLRAGEKAKVPEYAAIYLMCRGMALYGY